MLAEGPEITIRPGNRPPRRSCLLLLYGQQLSRIAALTTGQVTSREDAVFIRLGKHDAPVPGLLGTALLELIRDGSTHTGVGTPTRTRWLFPGGMPGRPITGSQLGERLRALGIYEARCHGCPNGTGTGEHGHDVQTLRPA